MPYTSLFILLHGLRAQDHQHQKGACSSTLTYRSDSASNVYSSMPRDYSVLTDTTSFQQTHGRKGCIYIHVPAWWAARGCSGLHNTLRVMTSPKKRLGRSRHHARRAASRRPDGRRQNLPSFWQVGKLDHRMAHIVSPKVGPPGVV